VSSSQQPRRRIQSIMRPGGVPSRGNRRTGNSTPTSAAARRRSALASTWLKANVNHRIGRPTSATMASEKPSVTPSSATTNDSVPSTPLNAT
jgi:hypothetical protein